MVDPLRTIRCLIECPADAVRWASVLEATAPKAGNVYPGKPFDDLTHRHFLIAADIAADSFADSTRRFSDRIVAAVERTVESTGTNVNLGILLLLGPIVAADESLGRTGSQPHNLLAWQKAIGEILDSMDSHDAASICRAIAQSSAGGLGKVDTMDVHDLDAPSSDLMTAMRLAQSYDRIARQYASHFVDLISNVVPVVEDSIRHSGDLLGGISIAHLKLLAIEPDTLIARKNGLPVATRIQRRAQKLLIDDTTSVAQFDQLLRTGGHHLNPGTTADLIAAAIYLLLRTSC